MYCLTGWGENSDDENMVGLPADPSDRIHVGGTREPPQSAGCTLVARGRALESPLK
jgi:hypothetical protein